MYNGQVAGFVKVFEKFAYTTIRGSGHMAPTDAPGQVDLFIYFMHLFYFIYFILGAQNVPYVY